MANMMRAQVDNGFVINLSILRKLREHDLKHN